MLCSEKNQRRIRGEAEKQKVLRLGRCAASLSIPNLKDSGTGGMLVLPKSKLTCRDHLQKSKKHLAFLGIHLLPDSFVGSHPCLD